MKLAHKLDSVYQDPLFLVFLDLQKAYYTVDFGCLMTTLEGYGAGTHMCSLLSVFWDQKEVVTCKNGYHDLNFKAIWGTSQSGLISPTLFNLIVDNVVRNYLALTVEDQLVDQ